MGHPRGDDHIQSRVTSWSRKVHHEGVAGQSPGNPVFHIITAEKLGISLIDKTNYDL